MFYDIANNLFGFGGGFGSPKVDIMKALSVLPEKVIEIIELYNVDVTKYISKMSGLIQTKPLLEDYDFCKMDRRVLIEYAMQVTKNMQAKEQKYLDIFQSEVDNGDFTFMNIYRELKQRVEMRSEEGDLSDLYDVKFRKKKQHA